MWLDLVLYASHWLSLPFFSLSHFPFLHWLALPLFFRCLFFTCFCLFFLILSPNSWSIHVLAAAPLHDWSSDLSFPYDVLISCNNVADNFVLDYGLKTNQLQKMRHFSYKRCDTNLELLLNLWLVLDSLLEFLPTVFFLFHLTLSLQVCWKRTFLHVFSFFSVKAKLNCTLPSSLKQYQ